jgi:tRNA U38,U39,U40 pseudouridine synthase TruA
MRVKHIASANPQLNTDTTKDKRRYEYLFNTFLTR